jgi:hypothetical protein
MWQRRSKDRTPVGGRLRQTNPVERQPTFSYYANRTSERPGDGPQDRQPSGAGTPGGGRRRRRRLVSQVPFWLVLVLAVVCAGKLLLLSNDPKIVVVDDAAVSYLQKPDVYAAAAKQVFAGDVTNHVKLTADLNGMAAQLEQRFPELEAVSVATPFIGSRPIVYVVPAQPNLVLRTTTGAYAVNKMGVVLAELPAGVSLDALEVTDKSGVQPTPGKQILPSSTVRFIQMVAFQLEHAKQSIISITLPEGSSYEVAVQLADKPFVVRFNLQADARQQAGAALATLERLGGAGPNEYLDVRTPGRVYYR